MRTTSSLASHDLWCLEAPIAWWSWCTMARCTCPYHLRRQVRRTAVISSRSSFWWSTAEMIVILCRSTCRGWVVLGWRLSRLHYDTQLVRSCRHESSPCHLSHRTLQLTLTYNVWKYHNISLYLRNDTAPHLLWNANRKLYAVYGAISNDFKWPRVTNFATNFLSTGICRLHRHFISFLFTFKFHFDIYLTHF